MTDQTTPEQPAPDDDGTVTVVHPAFPDTVARKVPADDAQGWLDQGWLPDPEKADEAPEPEQPSDSGNVASNTDPVVVGDAPAPDTTPPGAVSAPTAS